MLPRTAAALFLFAGIAFSAPVKQQDQVVAGSPADSLEVRHLVLKGSNEEIGRALAQLARERYGVRIEPNADPLRNGAQRHYIEKNYPILYERMRGVAAAFGQRLEDDSRDYSSLGFTELHAGCSVVYLPPRSTAARTGVVSRDYDYSTGSLTFGFLPPGLLHPTARPYVMELHPDRGYASVAIVAYDLLNGVLDGMNSEGLTVALAMDDEMFTRYPTEPVLGPGVGLGEVSTLRMLLDTCATAEEAKQALLQTKQFYGYVPVHYLIADRFGNSFVWEYSHAHNKEFIVENPNRPLVMTNFTLSSHLDGNKPPSVNQARGICNRYCLLTDALTSAPPASVTEDFIRQTHKRVDAETAPAADASRPPVRTFWHALYYPEQRRMKVSFYLHDELLPDQPNRVKAVRTDYLEFQLSPTSAGKGSAPAATPASAAVIAPSGGNDDGPVQELRKGGAAVSVDAGRAVAVDLSKVDHLESVLPLLRKLPDLTDLTIQNKKMDDAQMPALAGLPKLSGLSLNASSISDEGLKVVKTLPSLRVLVISGTRVSDAGLADLSELTRLEGLGLRGDAITDAGLLHLTSLTNLTSLNLSETRISDAGLLHLQNLARLKVLILTGDDITDAGLAHLEHNTTISGLFLGSTKITDAGLEHLKGMNKLTKLNVSNTAVTDQGIAGAKKWLPFWATIQRDSK